MVDRVEHWEYLVELAFDFTKVAFTLYTGELM